MVPPTHHQESSQFNRSPFESVLGDAVYPRNAQIVGIEYDVACAGARTP